MVERAIANAPRLVFWEVTRACNLACAHCRAEAQLEAMPGQLTTEEAFRLVEEIAGLGSPIVVLTGGEPLLRKDVLDIARRGVERGLRMVLAPNGTLLTPELVHEIKDAGIPRISVSLDGSSAPLHDAFRQVPGAFEAAIEGLRLCREAGLPFQINTTVTKRNIEDLPAMLNTAVSLGAVAWHVFMLVPTGRGKTVDEVPPEDYEKTLLWLYEVDRAAPIQVKPTCAPHFLRIVRQRGGHRQPVGHPGDQTQHGHSNHPADLHTLTRGCLGGNGVCFISHVGEVFPCGYLPVLAGNVREKPFAEIYQQSPLFLELRDVDQLKGKCARCEYRRVCGGCRARAYAETGDYLAEEPYCIYTPQRG